MSNITTAVIDDSTFLSAKELDRRRDEVGYQKFNDIAHDFLYLSEVSNTLRADLNVYFMHHVKNEGDGILEEKTVRAMSHGKMIDEKLASVEAQFEMVLLSCKINGDKDDFSYKFKTRDKYSTVKTPMGLFTDALIDNDLNLVNKAIKCFYSEDCEEVVVVNNKKQVKE